MVSTLEVFTGKIPITVGKVGTHNKPSAREFLSKILALSDVKKIPAVLRMGSTGTKHN